VDRETVGNGGEVGGSVFVQHGVSIVVAFFGVLVVLFAGVARLWLAFSMKEG
jgi:hypothetical protein